MRLIGNKTRLVGEIEGFLRERGIRGGTLIDIFSGTASVGRHFKSLGFRVLANDHLPMCYTKAVHEVEVSSYPRFDVFRERRGSPSRRPESPLPAAGPLEEAIRCLNEDVEPREGIIFRHYAPGGGSGRKYFRDENALRIDGILHVLREEHREGALPRAELHLLLSALLDAADRVANISGTYGAYLKSWQRNALAPLCLRTPAVTLSPLANEAYREDANALVRRIRGDVLYADPPYNHRQYAANYHVLVIIAEHHAIEDLESYEEGLYGKTGLRPYGDLRSEYCVPAARRKGMGNALSAMTDLILSANVDHVVVSYNEEGLLSREELGAILARFSGSGSFDFGRNMRSISYRRFRSDADRSPANGRAGRRYKVIEGRNRNEIAEWLLFASRSRPRVRLEPTLSKSS